MSERSAEPTLSGMAAQAEEGERVTETSAMTTVAADQDVVSRKKAAIVDEPLPGTDDADFDEVDHGDADFEDEDIEELAMPEPPEEIVAVAAVVPDHWFYMPDRAWHGKGPAPEWAVVGRWRSNGKGEIVEWEDNEEYRPSPEAMGWPEPTDPLDAAVQRAATGYGPEEDVSRALAGMGEVAVIQGPGENPAIVKAPDGTQAVPIFTQSPYLADVDLPVHKSVSVTDLVFRIPDGAELYYFSPSAPVSIIVPIAEVLEALEGVSEADARPTGRKPVEDVSLPRLKTESEPLDDTVGKEPPSAQTTGGDVR